MTERIVQVVWPVTFCALYTCILIRILAWDLTPSQSNILDKTWRGLGVNVGAGGGLGPSAVGWTASLIIVLIISSLLVGVTLIILFILYMGWHRCLIYYFYLPSLIILAVVTPGFIRSVLRVCNSYTPDIYTAVLFTWNFTALGAMAIFGLYAASPLCLQQFYLIHNSAMLSVLIIHALPGWAPWLLLAFLVMWDLFAVLAPFGPLNLIINLADREGVAEMPGLIYTTEISGANSSTTEAHLSKRIINEPKVQDDQAKKERTPNETLDPAAQSTQMNQKLEVSQSPRQKIERDNSVTQCERDNDLKLNEREQRVTNNETTDKLKDTGGGGGLDPGETDSSIERGVSIGLGDFIFYSLLIGLTSKGRSREDFYTVLATLAAVLFGLVLTLIILALTKRALPALPISIALGLMVATLTSQFAAPLSNGLAARAIFI